MARTLRLATGATYARCVLDWDFRGNLDAQPEGPLYMRIVGALSEGIRTGRLRPGVALPGTRRLAESLGVHRSTVLAAFRELVGEGVLETRPNQGTYIAEVSGPSEPGGAVRPSPTVQSPRLASPRRALSQAAPLALSHLPCGADFPSVPLARAYRRAIGRHASDVLDYANRTGDGSTFGMLRLREALAEMLSRTRGLPLAADNLLVTNGSQMALYLIAHTIITPGDVVAVECYGYQPVWEAFRLAGATLVPIPVDDEGLCVDQLRELAKRTKIRAVYVTPHHQHPTAVTLSPSRRRSLLAVAEAEDITVIEDDYDCDFAYDGRSVLALASAETKAQVIYVGSLAKVLGPGPRIGYTVAPPAVLASMARRRAFIDRQGDHALSYAVAELLEEGHLRRHVQRLYGVYRARRSALVHALRSELGDVVTFDVPRTGTALWGRVAPGVDVERWLARGRERGVHFHIGRSFAFDGAPCPFARFGYASLNEDELRTAVQRLVSALPLR